MVEVHARQEMVMLHLLLLLLMLAALSQDAVSPPRNLGSSGAQEMGM